MKNELDTINESLIKVFQQAGLLDEGKTKFEVFDNEGNLKCDIILLMTQFVALWGKEPSFNVVGITEDKQKPVKPISELAHIVTVDIKREGIK